MLDFSASGYIEVHRDGVLVSKHRQEREAIESVLRHAAGKPSGTYEIRYPVVRVKYTAPEPPATPTVTETGTIDGGGRFYDLGELVPVTDLPATWARLN